MRTIGMTLPVERLALGLLTGAQAMTERGLVGPSISDQAFRLARAAHTNRLNGLSARFDPRAPKSVNNVALRPSTAGSFRSSRTTAPSVGKAFAHGRNLRNRFGRELARTGESGRGGGYSAAEIRSELAQLGAVNWVTPIGLASAQGRKILSLIGGHGRVIAI